MGDSIKKKMIGALAWTSVNVFGVQIIQLVIGILLARWLDKTELGKIAVLFIFIGLSTVLIDGGYGQALIRKKDATAKDINTLFLFNLTLSVLLYITLFFSAPYIAIFFKEPELAFISRILFIAIIFYALYFIQQTQLVKKLDYKSIAIVNVVSVALSSVIALVIAIINPTVWVVVFQQLSFHLIKVILFPFFLHWKPSREFSFKTIKELSGFSLPMLGQSTLNVIFANIYATILGRNMSLSSVADYNQAYKFSDPVNTVTQTTLATGTFPIFAEIQDDQPRLLRIYRRLSVSVTMLSFPLVAFLILAAKPIIITLITEKWLESVVLLQLLLLSNLFHPIYTININILNARGESGNTFKLEIFKKILITISIVACYSWGIEAMLTGLVAANFISFAASMVYIKKSLIHYFRNQILDLTVTLAVVAVIGGLTYTLKEVPLKSIYLLIFQGVTFVVLYFFAVRMFFPEQFKEIKAGIQKQFGK